MKPLPTLYARGENDKVLEWDIEVEGNKYRMITGAQGFAKVTSEWTICAGKNIGRANETTPEEQAQSEAKSKWKKKQDSKGYRLDIKDIDSLEFEEPMRAEKYYERVDTVDFTTGKWGLQCKFNGNRCLARKDGFYTRGAKKYLSIPHIEKALKPFFDKYPDAVLDGELFNYDLRQSLNELNKLVRKSVKIKAEDLVRSEQIVRFYIYDGHDFPGLGMETSYTERKSWLDTNVIGTYKYCEKVDTEILKSLMGFEKSYGNLIEDAQEGAILRHMDKGYEYRRSVWVLKVKPEDDDEAIIDGAEEGVGNGAGTCKKIWLIWKGKRFKATFKGTYEQGVQFLKDFDRVWKGKEVTFLYNGLTGETAGGVPNYARVDINNCLKGDR